MNPLKHKLANEWMRQDDASPEEALDTWNTMEAEFKVNRAALQEPRTMAQEPRNMAHGGEVIGKPGGIVEPGVEYYATSKVKTDKFKYPGGNVHGKWWSDKPGRNKQESIKTPQVKEKVKKFIKDNPNMNQKEGIEVLGKRKAELIPADQWQKPGKKRKVEPSETKKRARVKKIAMSSESMLAEMAGKEGHHLSHLSLTQLDSLKNLGYLPKDINIKSYHSFEKKIVANAKEIYAAQNNKSLSIPERRAKIAELQKVDRSLRKEFPNYANIKARLKVQATKLDPSGVMIKEIIDPTVAISQEAGTTLKGITPTTEKGRDILKLSKKSLEAKIIESLKNNPKLAKEVQMSLKAGIPIDEILKSPAVKKAMPWIKGEGIFAVAEAINNWTKGQSFKKGAQKAIETGTFGLLDLAADEKALVDYAERQGLSKKEIDAMRNYLYYMKEKKNNEIYKHRLEFREANEGDSTQIVDYGEQIFSAKDVEKAKDKVTQSDTKLQELTDKYFETSFDGSEGAMVLQNMMEGLTAEEWNKPAGTFFDRGNRLDQGSGSIWDMFNIPFSKPTDTLDYLNPLDKQKPQQELMIKHPVYGYKEQIREMQEKGIDPMEDINYSMDYAKPLGVYATGGIASLMKKKW